jgi:hypothetical protein
MGMGSRWAAGARIAALLAVPVLISACQTVAVTALGVGASAGLMHTANGMQYRTFTASPGQVKRAVLTALARMGIAVEDIDKREGADVIIAHGASRSIEIELEAMSRSTTQLRATAKHNVFVHDSATAREIVEQTEAALEARGEPRGRRAGRLAAEAATPATLR